MSNADAARLLALQEKGGFFVLGPRSRFRLTGSDRVRYLNGQVSNDVRKAVEDKVISACVLTAKGKLCALAWLRSIGDALEIDAVPELRESLAERLERYIIADDVELEDVSKGSAIVHIFGPAAGLLETPGESGEKALEATRLSEAGIDYWVNAKRADEWAEHFKRSGLLEATRDEWEELRIGAGIPEWGSEIDENTLPQEAGLETHAVDFHKGCYVGQEVVSRIRSVGRVNRRLCRLLVESGAAIESGLGLFDDEGREIGRITSVGRDFGLANRAALGYVKTPSALSGTRLGLLDGEGRSKGTVLIQ